MFKSIYNNVTIREALETYKRVNSFRKTAKICGMSKSTIHRWWSTFFLLCTRSKIQKKKHVRRKRKSKYPTLEKQVNELFSSKNLKFCSLKDVAKNLDNPPSISWLHRTLKKCKISRRRFTTTKVCGRSQEELSSMYKDFSTIYKSFGINEIVCLDEVSFCNIGNTNYGYFKKGDTPIQHSVKGRERYSFVVAISSQGCVSYQQQRSAFNKPTFLSFITNLIPKLPLSTKCILMDNVRFHHSTEVISLLKEHDIVPLYIPPYSPRCNPIEEVFSVTKRYFRSKYNENNDFEASLKSTTSFLNLFKDLTPYYNHTKQFLQCHE